MSRPQLFLIACAALALAACSSQPAVDGDAAGAPAAQACNADAASDAVGKAATPDVVEQARRASGAAVARVLHPGEVVTMEYRADRLNLEVDAGNVVVAVRCG